MLGAAGALTGAAGCVDGGRDTTDVQPRATAEVLATGGGVGVGDTRWRGACGARKSTSLPRPPFDVDDAGCAESTAESSGVGMRESMRLSSWTLRFGS